MRYVYILAFSYWVQLTYYLKVLYIPSSNLTILIHNQIIYVICKVTSLVIVVTTLTVDFDMNGQ